MTNKFVMIDASGTAQNIPSDVADKGYYAVLLHIASQYHNHLPKVLIYNSKVVILDGLSTIAERYKDDLREAVAFTTSVVQLKHKPKWLEDAV